MIQYARSSYYYHHNYNNVYVLYVVGEHPRMGAMDVCPFIPVQNVTMEDCVECAKEFGEKLAMELGVPGKKS